MSELSDRTACFMSELTVETATFMSETHRLISYASHVRRGGVRGAPALPIRDLTGAGDLLATVPWSANLRFCLPGSCCAS